MNYYDDYDEFDAMIDDMIDEYDEVYSMYDFPVFDVDEEFAPEYS